MLRYKVDKLEQLLKRLDHRVVQKALERATDRTAKKLATEVSNRVRARYNISKKDFDARMTVRKSVKGDLASEVRITGQPIGIINFASQTRKVTLARKAKKGKGRPWGRFRTGASVKVLKVGGRKPITSKSAFIAKGLNGNEHIWYRDPTGKRTRSGKVKLHPMKMLSAPDMAKVVEKDMAADYQFFISSNLNQEFDHQLKYLLGEIRKK